MVGTFKIAESQTNVQEPGLDEADLIKNENGWIYTVSGNHLNIVRGYPINNFQKTSSVQFNQIFKPEAIFIEGNNLAVFGTKTTGGKTSTLILIYDITNKYNIQFKFFYDFQGEYFDGRKNGATGYVYIVSHNPVTEYPWYNIGNGKTNLFLQNIRVFPPFNPGPKSFINIVSFNLQYPNQNHFNMKSIITEQATEIYMSYRSIYITYTDVINGIDHTRIFKIYVWGIGIWSLWATKVEGTIHNQFAMDEYLNTGVLRIATTRLNNSQAKINIYTLNFYFQILGQRKGIYPGNRITATRYFGKTLYIGTSLGKLIIVTFIPNHYWININSIRSLNGLPRYMHLLNSQLLLTFGKNIGDKGLKVWIYNVANPSNPYANGEFVL